MKKKNVNGKLSLKKETLSNLSENGKEVNGGISGMACFISLEAPGLCGGTRVGLSCHLGVSCGLFCYGSDFC